MIQAVELTKQFSDVPAVDSVSFTVAEGETLGLIGTSGCGKTTTLRMVNRLVEPTSGQVFIRGEDVSHQPPEVLRRRIGYVIQNIGLFPHYTVEDNVAVVPRLLNQREGEIKRRSDELLDLVGLPPSEFAQRYPHELSGGQQQRVGFARALAADPAVILLDEPFGGLDQVTRTQIQKDFRELKGVLGKTVILVTHDVFEAVFLCDRLCLMDRGRVQQVGTPADLIFQPANAFVREFFRSQRFLAALQVIRFGDLEPYLTPSALRPNTTAVCRVTSENSVLDLLQQLEELPSGEIELVVEGNSERRSFRVTVPILLEAFEKIRTKLSLDTAS